MKRVLLFLLGACLIPACEPAELPMAPADEAAFATGTAPGISDNAIIQFGAMAGHHGTDFPPASHDASFHSVDRAFPAAVNIRRGGSVTFLTGAVHQAAVYAPGTTLSDIDTSQLEPIPVLPFLDRITDTTNRVALGPDQSFAPASWTTPPGTFDAPGTYLVICTTLVHFQGANMYARVHVM